MLSAIFISGGAAQLADPASHVPQARSVTDEVQELADENDVEAVADADATQMVQLNGLVQVVGGLLLAFGKLPRLAALLLAGSLVPTTLAGHRFWEERDPAEKQRQQTHFFKNVSLLGGLLIATMDREGKPSIAWRSGHAVDHARIAADHAKEVTHLKGELAKEKARRAAAVDAGDHLRVRKDLAKARAKQAAAVDASDHLRVRKDLVKKQLTPDITDAKSLVDTFRSDEDA